MVWPKGHSLINLSTQYDHLTNQVTRLPSWVTTNSIRFFELGIQLKKLVYQTWTWMNTSPPIKQANLGEQLLLPYNGTYFLFPISYFQMQMTNETFSTKAKNIKDWNTKCLDKLTLKIHIWKSDSTWLEQ